MDETAKYLVRADITAEGVVDRSDVVGAIYGQTEGLLGDELDIHDLQQSSRLGRIDVEITSERGRSTGEIEIASNLDKVETAVFAAALEVVERVGPCEATIEVREIADARAAKRQAVVERARDLLNTAFDETALSSAELVESVRESLRVGTITDYEGYPAGPNVADSDAIIVVEGRSDVLTLLGYGIKNAVAVEGTNVPDAVADLTRDRTTTAFLDGDRGGDLILRELAQVGAVDYVARAPSGSAVEDLPRETVVAALREKSDADVALAALAADDADDAGEHAPAASGSTTGAVGGGEPPTAGGVTDEQAPDGGTTAPTSERAAPAAGVAASTTTDAPADAQADASTEAGGNEAAEAAETGTETPTLAGHVEAVVGQRSGSVRLLDDSLTVVDSGPADEAFDLLERRDAPPAAVVLDGAVTQRLVDLAAQRGVARVVGRERGEFTKQPVSVRVHVADELVGT